MKGFLKEFSHRLLEESLEGFGVAILEGISKSIRGRITEGRFAGIFSFIFLRIPGKILFFYKETLVHILGKILRGISEAITH